MAEDAIRLHQLGRRALLGDRAVLQHHNLVRAGNGTHPVGDNENGFILNEAG